MAYRKEDRDGGTAALVFLFCICDVGMSGTIGGAIVGIEVWRYGVPSHSRSVHIDELWMSNCCQ